MTFNTKSQTFSYLLPFTFCPIPRILSIVESLIDSKSNIFKVSFIVIQFYKIIKFLRNWSKNPSQCDEKSTNDYYRLLKCKLRGIPDINFFGNVK